MRLAAWSCRLIHSCCLSGLVAEDLDLCSERDHPQGWVPMCVVRKEVRSSAECSSQRGPFPKAMLLAVHSAQPLSCCVSACSGAMLRTAVTMQLGRGGRLLQVPALERSPAVIFLHYTGACTQPEPSSCCHSAAEPSASSAHSCHLASPVAPTCLQHTLRPAAHHASHWRFAPPPSHL